MTHPYILRSFEPEYADGMADLHRRAILAISPRFYSKLDRENWAHGIDPAAYPRIAANEETFLVACQPSGGPLGFASWKTEGALGVLCGLFVAPDVQGTGIGSALLHAAEGDMIRLGAGRIEIHASLSALVFYARHGYEALARMVRRTRAGPELRMWHMEKTL